MTMTSVINIIERKGAHVVYNTYYSIYGNIDPSLVGVYLKPRELWKGSTPCEKE